MAPFDQNHGSHTAQHAEDFSGPYSTVGFVRSYFEIGFGGISKSWKERGKVVQGTRAQRREVASWMWEMVSECLAHGAWKVVEMGKKGVTPDPVAPPAG
jgi:hypothetical protein